MPADCGQDARSPKSLPRSHEVDEAAVDVDAYEFHVRALADIQPFLTVNDLAFDWRLENAHPGAFLRCTGDDGVEALTDARRKEARRGGFAHLALDLVRRILLRRAVHRQRAELLLGVRGRLAVQRGLQQAMGDQIG